MKTAFLSDRDIAEIFHNQPQNGSFQVLATLTAGLNYLDVLNRQRLDLLASTAQRTAARHRQTALACRLYNFLREKTPLSLFDADYREEANLYILARRIFLTGRSLTFKRHRLSCLLDLLRLYRDDPCQILTGREALLQELENTLLTEFILLDMGWKNTADLGLEAIGNGYHECDYTLDIEEEWKQPVKSVPRQHFKYLCQSLSSSHAAACVLYYMKDHRADMVPSLWAIDEKALAKLLTQAAPPEITKADVAAVAATYIRKD